MATMERFGPTRRGGPLFRWLGEPLGIDLANTVMVVRPGETVDLLTDDEGLERWRDGERDRLGVDVEELAFEDIRPLRDAVRMLFAQHSAGEPPDEEALRLVNAISAASPIVQQLEGAPGGEGYVRTAAPVEVGGKTRALGALARSAIELLSEPSDHLKLCQAPSCGMFFLGSRRWCCSACGNRARAARHYERTRRVASRR
jgi:predicted RNA-binding Zn ribbon-like protein